MFKYLIKHIDSLGSIGIRGLSILAGFGITFYIGREMGPVANGQYALVTQTAMFLSIVAVGGVAIAISALLIGRNLASFYAVYRLVGINILTGSYVPPSQAASK